MSRIEDRPQPERRGGSLPSCAHPLVVMPAATAVLYFALFASGLWTRARLGPYNPVPASAFAALFALAFLAYGEASAAGLLIGVLALWAGYFALSLFIASASRWIIANGTYETRMVMITINVFVAAFAFSAGTMAVSAALCPMLRRPLYWLILISAWCVLSAATPEAIGWLTALGIIDRSSLQSVYMAAFAGKYMVVFALLGYWLHQASRSATAPPERAGGA